MSKRVYFPVTLLYRCVGMVLQGLLWLYQAVISPFIGRIVNVSNKLDAES